MWEISFNKLIKMYIRDGGISDYYINRTDMER